MKEMSETKKNIITIAVALGILVLFIGINIYSSYKKSIDESGINGKRTLVVDNGRYFTVMGIVKKYLNYVQNGNNNEILSIIDEEYKKEYNVTSSNLSNFIPKLDRNLTYDYFGKEMYQKRLTKSITEYYVYGEIKSTILDETPNYYTYNMTVILYEDELLFAIRPGVDEE